MGSPFPSQFTWVSKLLVTPAQLHIHGVKSAHVDALIPVRHNHCLAAPSDSPERLEISYSNKTATFGT